MDDADPLPAAVAEGTPWGACVTPDCLLLQVGGLLLPVPRVQALQLAHMIFAAYGVSGPVQ